ncbi:MAG: 23S rRNA (cytidine(2498)-2'-O)-methyltransferase RlmM [Xanthomonadaceae bacterium]|jgi:23S rRNA (cytidine2498-2'-O)-methyltransferase|nr:23S rRNA (cytidine(2498)-2'-O)-methyltransferase RlmM [Xanthomonadaceae bacterium]
MSPDLPSAVGLLCHCRAGFEAELAAELTERAAAADVVGYARAQRNDAYALFFSDDTRLGERFSWRELIFARQKLRLLAELRDVPPTDRISPILQLLRGLPRFGDVWVEHPDSDSGKPLAGLTRSFANALRPALRREHLLSDRPRPEWPRLHVLFLAGDHLLLAYADPADSAPWPLGIPRLKLHPDAPSRSALKLEEALLTLLSDTERDAWLQPGMRAADLGAAPGGWTWVLARRHLHVTAIDNGPLRPHVLETGLVEHLRADGFHWRPSKPLDWLVCDMVEQPRRVAVRIGEWFQAGWCRHAIFNLKLPMKKRWQETQVCLERFRQSAAIPLTVRARQLYHDREEITVFASTAVAPVPSDSNG